MAMGAPIPQEPKQPTSAQPGNGNAQMSDSKASSSDPNQQLADQMAQVASNVLNDMSSLIAVLDKMGDKMGVKPEEVDELKKVADGFVQVMQVIMGGDAGESESGPGEQASKGPSDQMGGPNGKPL